MIGWIARPWYGPFFAASMTLGHGFVSAIPELDILAFGGGLAFGYSWDLPFGFNLAISGGLRRMEILERDGQICTLPGHCVFASEEFLPRFELTFGYRF
ncbi:MAG: hypothetical protein HC927_02320 [Deltaproteobacteria bacterium]|nr:hypothetical protein [Deltaproteobacteria bacterium]